MDFSTLTSAPFICHAPRESEKVGAQASFPTFWWVKPALLAQTRVETLTINTSLPHS